jgi:hypothetical protein
MLARKSHGVEIGFRLWLFSSNASLEFQGALNELYSITSNDVACLVRVCLPVDPAFKTSSEVATLALLQVKTTIPVAEVVAHCPLRENEIGLE